MYRKNTADCLQNRYRVTGTLTAKTPVHVGDGERLALRARHAHLQPDAPDSTYSSCVTGSDGAMVLPGPTLKGVLRAWLRRQRVSPRLVEAVFGTEEGGGKAEFHFAPLKERAPGDNERRWWDARRGTCLAPGVSLDPRTRTAREHLLYYTEYAPEGTTFAVTVTAQNLSEAERDLLLSALDAGFNDNEDPVRVGAGTASGWGALAWSLAACAVIERADVAAWVQGKAATAYTEIFRPIAVQVKPLRAASAAATLVLDVRLHFDGAFLANDPSQEERRDEQAGTSGVGHATVRRRDGTPFLPGASVRGALHAQARRIWQSMAHDRDGYLPNPEEAEVKRKSDLRGISFLHRMFGASGWRSPITVPDFALVEARPHSQEFVAVDRFTGGAAEQKKFNARGLYAPVFSGTISIDLTAWEAQRANVGGAGMLLLLYLLRDLQEGDVQFGFGAAKGYGACVATIEVRRRGDIPAACGGNQVVNLLRGVLDRDAQALTHPLLQEWNTHLQMMLGQAAA